MLIKESKLRKLCREISNEWAYYDKGYIKLLPEKVQQLLDSLDIVVDEESHTINVSLRVEGGQRPFTAEVNVNY